MTHAALLSDKYKKFIINDVDARMPQFFIDCVFGKYTVENHPEWISREEFFKRKDDDVYVAIVWSFGNNGKDYIYGKEIEPVKRAYHKAIYTGDASDMRSYGYSVTVDMELPIYDRYLDVQSQMRTIGMRSDLDSIVRQKELESLMRLQSLQSLRHYGMDYQDVSIPKNALIYCDIPYSDTNSGKYQGFDHERFYKWAKEQDNIYISEYKMPDDFIMVAETEKIVLSAANSNSIVATERIFTNERTYSKLRNRDKVNIQYGLAKQMTLWEVM